MIVGMIVELLGRSTGGLALFRRWNRSGLRRVMTGSAARFFDSGLLHGFSRNPGRRNDRSTGRVVR